MSIKSAELSALDDLCQKVFEKEGTIYTEVFSLAYEVRRQVDNCHKLGAIIRETGSIISKYSSND